MHTVQELSLGFSEWWRAAGVPKTVAENWSSRRPLKIRASIRDGGGKGIPNLYSVHDAYLLALLFLLRRSGLSAEALSLTHSLITQFDNFAMLRDSFASRTPLIIAVRRKGLDIEQAIQAADGSILLSPLRLEACAELAIQYVVGVGSLKDAVDGRIAKLLRKRKRECK